MTSDNLQGEILSIEGLGEIKTGQRGIIINDVSVRRLVTVEDAFEIASPSDLQEPIDSGPALSGSEIDVNLGVDRDRPVIAHLGRPELPAIMCAVAACGLIE